VPAFKPAYLIHGDDHGRIAERRARLRAVAERESGAGGVEVLEGDAATPAAAAAALATLTFALGRRFIVVDGAERWRDKDVEAELAPMLADPPPDTTIAFFAREEGRTKAPAALHRAVKSAKGEIAQETTVKPWELPAWTREQAARLGLHLDSDASHALLGHVGERQQRIMRELEKLALATDPEPSPERPARVQSEQLDSLLASSAEHRGWTLADALVGSDAPAAVGTYLSLRAQGERLSGLIYWIAQRLRLALEVAERLEAGESEATVRRSLRMPSKAASRFLADVRGSDPDHLRAALEKLARLEYDSRGGPLGAVALEEDTLCVRALAQMAGS
jgi:DNA polymerase-3 subunit delta